MAVLKRKVALVTGGSRGLGAEVVREMARQGAEVAFTYTHDRDSARALTTEIRRTGRKALAFKADAADFARAADVVTAVREKLGGLHILVCNAGFARSAPIHQMSEDDWDSVMAVSLKGAFNYIRAAAPAFISQVYGKVVCVGSINGLRGRIGSASYNAAKAGLEGLVKTVAAELGRFNVNANVVAPGFIDTPSQAKTPELIRNLVLNECAIKRLGTPADIAPLVTFLVSDAARHITGQVIKVDAGQYI